MFDMKSYLESMVWEENDLFIDPADAAKRCACCGVRFYSVEFPNMDEFFDGKLPVCTVCLKSRKLETAVAEILSGYDVYKECAGKNGCGQTKHFTSFLRGYRKHLNGFDGRCDECRPAQVEWWKNLDDD